MVFRFVFLASFACCINSWIRSATAAETEDGKFPNILIITVDDMNADSLGTYGCPLPGTSPNIDSFARTAMRFQHAHVQVGNCMPGRNIMWSGMFAHANGVEGFVQNRSADYPVLCDLAQQAGYFAAIRGKTAHSTPYVPYRWDAVLDSDPNGKRYATKDAGSYGESTRRGIELARQANKPFCLMVNISDPHKPFYRQGRGGTTFDDPHHPSKTFSADEVPAPRFLPDDQAIRTELAMYYDSVRRADDCFAEILAALAASGATESTMVMFLSDHGMPFPFAKTQLYHHSTHTPLIIRWPGVTKADSIDDRHMVSAIDFLPTLLEVMQHAHPNPESLHGRSFVSLLRGQSQPNRDHVVLQYNENSGRSRHPMRGLHTRKFLYLYNPWSNGQRKFATATTGTTTYRQMVQRATSESAIAARLALFDHRVLEELYDIENDPDCLRNLVDDPDYAARRKELRKILTGQLRRTNDPVAPLLAAVDDDQLRERFMAQEDERAATAKRARRNSRPAKPGQPRGVKSRRPGRAN